MRRLHLAALAGLLLGACAVGPDFKPPKPPGAADYGHASEATATAAAQGPGGDAQHFVPGADVSAQWWTLYRSPQLTALVEEALRANPNVAAAQASLREARELYYAQRSSLFPTLSAGASAARAKNPQATIANPTVSTNPTYNLFTAQLSVSYLPDVFGGGRRAVEAAHAQADSSRFQLEATYLTLSSNVVVTVIAEAALRGQISATERLLALQTQLAETARRQRAIGAASQLDVLAQESAQAQTAATLAPLRKQLALTRDALTALLGRLPSEEPGERFELSGLTLPTELPVSLPSRLVTQRPDVRQAEANLHAASAQVGVAVADMLPQFAITGDLGSSALTLSALFTPYTGFWDAGASLTQILFDAGALRHRKRAADAALDAAAAQYRAAVILACQNVADALRSLQSDAEALAGAQDAQHAAEATLALARKQQALGALSFDAVLNVEQGYLQTEVAMVQAEANRYADTAALFQALGGGWWNRPAGSAP